jgi:hypothetical protein
VVAGRSERQSDKLPRGLDVYRIGSSQHITEITEACTVGKFASASSGGGGALTSFTDIVRKRSKIKK